MCDPSVTVIKHGEYDDAYIELGLNSSAYTTSGLRPRWIPRCMARFRHTSSREDHRSLSRREVLDGSSMRRRIYRTRFEVERMYALGVLDDMPFSRRKSHLWTWRGHLFETAPLF